MTTTSLPDTVRHFRRRARLSQAKLAELIEADHSYVSRIESRDRVPSRSVVERIADVLELTPEERDQLLFAGGYAPSAPLPMLPPPLGELWLLLTDARLTASERDLIHSRIAGLVDAMQALLGGRAA